MQIGGLHPRLVPLFERPKSGGKSHLCGRMARTDARTWMSNERIRLRGAYAPDPSMDQSALAGILASVLGEDVGQFLLTFDCTSAFSQTHTAS